MPSVSFYSRSCRRRSVLKPVVEMVTPHSRGTPLPRSNLCCQLCKGRIIFIDLSLVDQWFIVWSFVNEWFIVCQPMIYLLRRMIYLCQRMIYLCQRMIYLCQPMIYLLIYSIEMIYSLSTNDLELVDQWFIVCRPMIYPQKPLSYFFGLSTYQGIWSRRYPPY